MRITVETYGCSVNQADSEVIAGLAAQAGHELVDKNPDVMIVNTCTVKTPTERKIRKRLRKLADTGVKVLVAGCLPAAQSNVVDEFPQYSFIGVNSHDVLDALCEMETGGVYVNIACDKSNLGSPRVKRNTAVGIIPISQGCLGSCSYCITKKARGKLKSYTIKDITYQAQRFIDEGCVELWLTSQDNGCWGHDRGRQLPQLLEEVCEVDGDFKVRVGMMNPQYALEMVDDLVKVFGNQKLYRFFHIPVQAGSDKVLKDMNRGYTTCDFEKLVGILREKLDATISTDVIAGYVTETDKDFEKTMELLQKVQPDVLNVSRYWPRPGTLSEKQEGYLSRTTKQRSRRVGQLFEETGLKQNEKWIGWQGEILVSNPGTSGSWTGRNQYYKPIVIRSDEDLLGKRLEVEVTHATYYDLRAKIV